MSLGSPNTPIRLPSRTGLHFLWGSNIWVKGLWIKFITQYGADVQLLADGDMAPYLHSLGSTIDSQDDVKDVSGGNAKDVFGLHLGPLRVMR